MREIFQKLFRGRQSAAEKLRDKQLRNAQIMQLQHQSAADYHQAVATMYRDQALRLSGAVRIQCSAADFTEAYNSRIAGHTDHNVTGVVLSGTAASFEKLQAAMHQGGAA